MRNLRKVMAFVVVFAMIFSSVAVALAADAATTTPAATPTATPAPAATTPAAATTTTAPAASTSAIDAKYAVAVSALGNLSVMVGDQGTGDFRPNDPIKRSEFAKIVDMASGIKDAPKGPTKFTDVAADHWASGFISAAAGLGIIKGTSETTFDPDASVTYEQATAMVVRSMGYEPAVAAKGGYPTGYQVIAAQEGILEGVSGTTGQAMKRADIAQMVYNALSAPLMITDSYGSDTRYIESGKLDDYAANTLLRDKMGYDVYPVTIDAVDEVKGTVKFSKKLVKGDYTDSDSESDKYTHIYNNFSSNSTSKTLYVVNSKVIVGGLEDSDAIVWVNDNDKIINIVPDKTSSVVYDYIKEIDGDDVTDTSALTTDQTSTETGFDIALMHSDDTYTMESYDAADKKDVIFKDDTSAEKNFASPTLKNLFDSFGGWPFNKLVKFTIKDSKIVKMEAVTMDVAGIITKVDPKVGIEYYQDDKDSIETYDTFTDSDYKASVVIIDAKVASLSDLKPDMYMTYNESYLVNDGKDKAVLIYANSKTVNGKKTGLTHSNSDYGIKIDGTEYTMESSVYYSDDSGATFSDFDADKLYDDDDFNDTSDVKVVLGGNNKIVYVIINPTTLTTLYGIAVKTSNTADGSVTVGAFVKDAYTETSYDLASKCDFIDSKQNKTTNITNVTKYLNSLDQTYRATDGKDYDVEAFKCVYKYQMNSDGKIEKITQLLAVGKDVINNATISNEKLPTPAPFVALPVQQFDESSNEIRTYGGTYDVSKASIFDTDAYDNKGNDIKGLKWADIKSTDDDRIDNKMLVLMYKDVDEEDSIAKVVLVEFGSDKLGETPVIGYVKDDPETINSDDMKISVDTIAGSSNLTIDRNDSTSLGQDFDEVNMDNIVVYSKKGDYANLYSYVEAVDLATYAKATSTATIDRRVQEILSELVDKDESGTLNAVGYGTLSDISSSSAKFNTAHLSMRGDLTPNDMNSLMSDSITPSIKIESGAIIYKFDDDANEYKSVSTSSLKKTTYNTDGSVKSKGDSVVFIVSDDKIVAMIAVTDDTNVPAVK